MKFTKKVNNAVLRQISVKEYQTYRLIRNKRLSGNGNGVVAHDRKLTVLPTAKNAIKGIIRKICLLP